MAARRTAKDPRVDAYVAKARPFARPILSHLRAVVRTAVPEAEETIKWGMPHWVHHGILCCMAGFNGHCALVVRRGHDLLAGAAKDDAMGQFGRITSLDDLPPKAELVRILRGAAKLNEAAEASPRKRAGAGEPARARKPEARVPPDLAAALRKDARARATFDAFPPSKRRDYVEWITGAKAAETRSRRLAQAVAWMAEGKARNWKYERC
ncbi:MAG TPA: YdeI/OmpD-associated family protein [Anaeromyxobacteraceae bacterium]|nr:YdeI/OmpD-associated family protein [Anaeromyxobacteraceae bacterium]